MSNDDLGTGSIHTEDFVVAITILPIAIAIVDRSGVVRSVNDHFCSRIGYSASDIVGQPISSLVPRRIRSKHDALVSQYFENPVTRSMGTRDSRVTIVKADGSEVPAEIGLVPCPNYDCVAAVVSPLSKQRDTYFFRSLMMSVLMLFLGLTIEIASRLSTNLQGIGDGQLLIGAGIASLMTLSGSRRPNGVSRNGQ